MSNIKIKCSSIEAKIPRRATRGSAGYDLYASEGVTIRPGAVESIHTDWAFQIPEGYFGMLVARSGLGTKGLVMANNVGIIDSDYRGEVRVPMRNMTDEEWNVSMGERVAQIIFVPYEAFGWELVQELDDTERGAGGFGSTGVK